MDRETKTNHEISCLIQAVATILPTKDVLHIPNINCLKCGLSRAPHRVVLGTMTIQEVEEAIPQAAVEVLPEDLPVVLVAVDPDHLVVVVAAAAAAALRQVVVTTVKETTQTDPRQMEMPHLDRDPTTVEEEPMMEGQTTNRIMKTLQITVAEGAMAVTLSATLTLLSASPMKTCGFGTCLFLAMIHWLDAIAHLRQNSFTKASCLVTMHSLVHRIAPFAQLVCHFWAVTSPQTRR